MKTKTTRKRVRGNGEGTISARRDQNGKAIGWKGSIKVGILSNGKVDRRWVSDKAKDGVIKKLEQLKRELENNTIADRGSTHLTVGQYLENYLESIATRCKPTTVENYGNAIRIHIAPAIGGINLRSLKNNQVQLMVDGWVKQGKSSATIKTAFKVLRAALKRAEKFRQVSFCATNNVETPRAERETYQTWSLKDAKLFFAHTRVRCNPLYSLWVLALVTGMRRGELLGLTWQDIDFAAGRLTVRNNLTEVGRSRTIETPKTRTSVRPISLTASTLALLADHRHHQTRRLAKHATTLEHDLVFVSRVNKMMSPRVVTRAFGELVKAVGLPKITLHGLRHLHATLLNYRGESMKVISDRLGHSSIKITGDIYTDVFEDHRSDAAYGLTELLEHSPKTKERAAQQAATLRLEDRESPKAPDVEDESAD
jgi:integrase